MMLSIWADYHLIRWSDGIWSEQIYWHCGDYQIEYDSIRSNFYESEIQQIQDDQMFLLKCMIPLIDTLSCSNPLPLPYDPRPPDPRWQMADQVEIVRIRPRSTNLCSKFKISAQVGKILNCKCISPYFPKSKEGLKMSSLKVESVLCNNPLKFSTAVAFLLEISDTAISSSEEKTIGENKKLIGAR